MIGGNYWMNLVKLDELVSQLLEYFRPLLNNEYNSEDEAMMDVSFFRIDFFRKNPQYKFFVPFINIECILGVAKKLPVRYSLDSILIIKLI